MTWFLRARRKSGDRLTDFCVGSRNGLVFCMRAGNYLVLVWASELTLFMCVVEIDLVSVSGIKLDLISM